MESYTILTNWRVILISVFSLFLSFSVNAESSSFDDGFCPAPTKFVKTSFNSNSKNLYVEWMHVPNAVGYKVSAKFDDGSSASFSTNSSSVNSIINVPAAAKSIILTVQTECGQTGQLSIGRTIVLRIIATQGDINDVIGLCMLIDHLLELGYTNFHVEHPITGEILFYLTYYGSNCANIEGGGFKPRIAQQDEILIAHFPNPFSEGLTIRYTIPSKSMVNLVVYDATGKVVEQSITDEIKESGVYDYQLYTEKLNPGVYFYKMIIDGKTTVNKIVKMN